MGTLRTLRIFLAFALLATVAALPLAAKAADATQTTLYFGLKTDNGMGVSEQSWARFLAEIVTPRFPDGLTVLDAYGQSDDHGPALGTVIAQGTRMLILVHPTDETAADAITDIKAAWRERFPTAGLFHTETGVRIVE
jgi:hypothetical protein